jgi:hypothetical protein
MATKIWPGVGQQGGEEKPWDEDRRRGEAKIACARACGPHPCGNGHVWVRLAAERPPRTPGAQRQIPTLMCALPNWAAGSRHLKLQHG